MLEQFFQLWIWKQIFIQILKQLLKKTYLFLGKLSNSKEKKYRYFINIDKGEHTFVIQYYENSDSIKFVLNTNP